MIDPIVHHRFLGALLLLVLPGFFSAGRAENITVTGKVVVAWPAGAEATKAGHGNAVVWLVPLDSDLIGKVRLQKAAASQQWRIVQKDKQFLPQVLPVVVGSKVEFPNLDPFFHNVFSLYEGKRFDLGLYEAGSSLSVTFDRPGICYIFCNIHPEMSATVVVVDSPLYAVSDSGGRFSIHGVPPGRYQLSLWHPQVGEDEMEDFPREIRLTAEKASLGTIRLNAPGNFPIPHKNKYGMDYEPAPADGLPLY